MMLLVRLFQYLPLIFGGTGLVVFLTYGIVGGGLRRLELVPLAGVIISVLLILANLGHLMRERVRGWYYSVLSGIYALGILFMGLRTKGEYGFARYGREHFLTMRDFSTYDVVVNVVGFIPLGFLVVVALAESGRLRTNVFRLAAAVAGCSLISLFMETAQYLIPARVSSLVDLMTNTFGALLGSVFALLYVKVWSMRAPG